MVNTRTALVRITKALTNEGIIAGAGNCELGPIAAQPNAFRAAITDLEGNVRIYPVSGSTDDEVVGSLVAAVLRARATG